MSVYRVTSQAEFDAALKAHGSDRYADIIIESPAGVWVEVGGSAGASDSATVTAYDSATVTAYGSATVTAYDSATVTAYDSATVRASGSATVTAYDSATVTAYDSATVRAYGSATVTAYDSATVRAYGSATVRASKFVAVHLHSASVKLTGGVVIDVTAIDLTDPVTWAAYTGAKVTGRGKAKVVHLFKAVDKDLNAGHDYRLTAYPVGEVVTAPDWKATRACGNGLHASPHPHQSLGYASSATRMLEVTALLADVIPLGDKVKAESFTVVREVRLDGGDL